MHFLARAPTFYINTGDGGPAFSVRPTTIESRLHRQPVHGAMYVIQTHINRIPCSTVRESYIHVNNMAYFNLVEHKNPKHQLCHLLTIHHTLIQQPTFTHVI